MNDIDVDVDVDVDVEIAICCIECSEGGLGICPNEIHAVDKCCFNEFIRECRKKGDIKNTQLAIKQKKAMLQFNKDKANKKFIALTRQEKIDKIATKIHRIGQKINYEKPKEAIQMLLHKLQLWPELHLEFVEFYEEINSDNHKTCNTLIEYIKSNGLSEDFNKYCQYETKKYSC